MTRWSLVARAGRVTPAASTAALNELLSAYYPVLRNHLVRNMRIAPDRADDLLQSFITQKILEKNVLAHADLVRGRFRSFLLKVFTNFVISEIRREHGKRRGPALSQMLSLDELPDAIPDSRPLDRAFDQAWARQILTSALEHMQRECTALGRADIWEIFEGRMLGPLLHDKPSVPYEELVERFKLRSPSQAANLLLTARRMFGRVLRDVVRETVTDESEIDGEIADLKAALVR